MKIWVKWIGNESKRDRFVTPTAISEKSKHTLSRRLNEMNFSKALHFLKFATEHVIGIEERWVCVHFSDDWMCNRFRCHGEGSFDAVLRNDIRLCALKAALNLEEEVWWCLSWFLLLLLGLLWNCTIKLTQLYENSYWRNMYIICELQLIKKLYLCNISIRVTRRSL